MAETLNVKFRYDPSPLQIQWINKYAKEKLFGGAKRGGKSVALAMHITLLSLAFPGNRGLLARKNMTDLKDSTLDEFFRTVPPELILDHNRGDRRVVLNTGSHPSEFIYRGLGDLSDFEKAKSVTTGWLAFDEPSEIEFQAYQQLLAQMTHTLPDGSRPPYMALLACNPEPGWVKQRFVDSLVDGGAYVQALPRDNPGLPPNWELELRASMDADWVKRYLDGSWDVFEGQVFTSLSERLHNLDNWTGGWGQNDWAHWREGLKKISSIDHATTGITACEQVGIDPDENMFSLDEYYEKNKLISEHCDGWDDEKRGHVRGIRQMLSDYGRQEYTLIDPSTQAKTQQGATELFSYFDDYRRNGVNCIPAHRHAIEIGINLLKEFLKPNPLRWHPFTGTLGSPRWFISKSRCPALWKEMIDLKKKLLPAGGVSYVGSDHAIDDVRYIAMSRPSPAAQKAADVAKLPPIDQLKVKVEAAFARKWSEKARGTGSWF